MSIINHIKSDANIEIQPPLSFLETRKKTYNATIGIDETPVESKEGENPLKRKDAGAASGPSNKNKKQKKIQVKSNFTGAS